MSADVQDIRGRLHDWASLALEPVSRTLGRWGFTPNQVTWAGTLLNLLAATLIINDTLIAAGLVWLLAGLLDLIDGSMARCEERASAFGAYLDSTLDRVSDGVVYSAIIFHFAALGKPVFAAVAALALLGALLTSYTRARAQSLNIECKVGLVTRAERIVLLGLGLCFGWLVEIIYILFVLSAVTVAQRILDAKRQLNKQSQNKRVS